MIRCQFDFGLRYFCTVTLARSVKHTACFHHFCLASCLLAGVFVSPQWQPEAAIGYRVRRNNIRTAGNQKAMRQRQNSL